MGMFGRDIMPGDGSASASQAQAEDGEVLVDTTNPDQVEAVLGALGAELQSREERIEALQEELAAARAVKAGGGGVAQQVGSEVASILQAAEVASDAMKLRAREEADRVHATAREEADRVHATVRTAAERVQRAQASLGELAAELSGIIGDVPAGPARATDHRGAQPAQTDAVLREAGLTIDLARRAGAQVLTGAWPPPPNGQNDPT